MLIAPLWLPILLSTVALFFGGFLSWMILGLHFHDWVKLPNEGPVLDTLRGESIPHGNYMVPGATSMKEMGAPEHQAKFQDGSAYVLSVFSPRNMGQNLGLTICFDLLASVCLAYLAALALKPGADFATVFRFVSTASLMTFLFAMLPHAIWFRVRIVGHVVESVAYSILVATIFAALWPKS
jgi:hypothetical protein